jgi:spectinomycin phosphotransferase
LQNGYQALGKVFSKLRFRLGVVWEPQRRGAAHKGCDALPLSFPKWLRDGGIQQIIPPLATTRGQLHTRLLEFAVTLYPFVAGRNGYEVALSGEQWLQLGATLRHMHMSEIPERFRQDFQVERFSSEWREAVKQFLERTEREEFEEAVARETASLLRAERTQILDLVYRAENLAQILKTQTPPFVPCHADLHAGNIHVANDSGLLPL